MLIVCPTPIGNLDDATPRQREALGEADVIACEDTRRTGKLLELLGIERREGVPRLVRYDEHSAGRAVDELIGELRDGRRVVLVSDAGTPTISDPGFRLVRACREEGLEVTALPGPCAGVVALSGSGIATDRFLFEGFLPTSTQRRQRRLEELDELGVTVVVYASPHRMGEVLEDLEAVCGSERLVCIGRELTKMHEEYVRGPAGEVRDRLEADEPHHGEFVVCLSPKPADDGSDEAWADADRLIEVLDDQGVSARTIKEVVDELHDVPRSEIYDRIHSVGD